MEVTLLAGEEAWQIPEETVVLVRYRKPDGIGGIYDTLPDGTAAWSKDGSKVTVILAPQMLTVPGCVSAQVELQCGDGVLATFTIQIIVEYRTTERYLGKSVYCKIVDCGGFPDAGTSKTITWASSGVVQHVVSAQGQTPDGHVFPTDNFSGTGGTISISTSQTGMSIYASGNWTAWTQVNVLMKYTKQAD